MEVREIALQLQLLPALAVLISAGIYEWDEGLGTLEVNNGAKAVDLVLREIVYCQVEKVTAAAKPRLHVSGHLASEHGLNQPPRTSRYRFIQRLAGDPSYASNTLCPAL